jgi:hypothetical protein
MGFDLNGRCLSHEIWKSAPSIVYIFPFHCNTKLEFVK